MTHAALGVGQMDSRCPRSGLCGFPCAATLPSRALFILTDGWCSWCEYATTDFSTDSRCDSGTFLCVTVLESVLGTFGWGPSECILVGHRSRSGLAGEKVMQKFSLSDPDRFPTDSFDVWARLAPRLAPSLSSCPPMTLPHPWSVSGPPGPPAQFSFQSWLLPGALVQVFLPSPTAGSPPHFAPVFLLWGHILRPPWVIFSGPSLAWLPFPACGWM